MKKMKYILLHEISWTEELLYLKQIPPKISSCLGNFVGMTRFSKSEGKCGEDTIGCFKTRPRRICPKPLINSVIPTGTKPNEVIMAL